MNTDIIREAAEERYPKQEEGVPFLCDSSDVSMFQREAFIEGYQLGAARERERMMKFAEWASRQDWKFYGLGWQRKNVNYTHDAFHKDPPTAMYENKTTSELLEIFNQENKER